MAGEDCTTRFQALLALDHSRTEPWGSRHGLAFAAFTLQHPEDASRESLEQSWAMLWRVYVAGDDPEHVIRGLWRLRGDVASDWDVPRLHEEAGQAGFELPYAPSVTIADLGEFDAATYADRLDAWCRSTLAAYGAAVPMR